MVLALLLPFWDFLFVLGAFLLAYWLRLHIAFSPETFILALPAYFKIALLASAVWVLIFSFFGLYRINPFRGNIDILGRLLGGVSVGVALLIITLFLVRDTFFSRLVLIYLWGLGVILLFIGRLIFSALVRVLAERGIGRERVLIIGSRQKVMAELVDYFKKHPNLGVEVVGLVAIPDHDQIKELAQSLGLPISSTLDQLDALIKQHNISQVILLEELPKALLAKLMWTVQAQRVRFRYLPSLLSLPSAEVEIMEAAGYPIMELKATKLDGWGRIIKRIFDFIFSILALIILSPVFLILAILIKLDSRGPVFYKGWRVGLGGNFKMYKFRTMFKGLSVGEEYGGPAADKILEELKARNEASGPLFKIKDDPRVTKFGRFLRQSSLDELPQLINVFRGEMSLVGPRPPLPEEVERYNKEHFRRLLVKPGMTGLWQISGRSDLPFEEYMRLDIHYVENWSFWLDLWILLRTIGVVLNKKGGY